MYHFTGISATAVEIMVEMQSCVSCFTGQKDDWGCLLLFFVFFLMNHPLCNGFEGIVA